MFMKKCVSFHVGVTVMWRLVLLDEPTTDGEHNQQQANNTASASKAEEVNNAGNTENWALIGKNRRGYLQ